MKDPKFERAYHRAMLRSAFVSLFWAVISDRKKQGLTLVTLAKAIGSSKHEVSRWFKNDPNWTINTIAAIANALKLRLQIQAVDEAGNVYGPSGLVHAASPKSPIVPTSDTSQQPPVKVTRKPAETTTLEAITSSKAA